MILVASQGFDQIVRALELTGDGIPRAAARALNRGIGSAQTVEKQAIAADLVYVKQADIVKTFKLVKASPSSLTASLTADDAKRIPLIKFGAQDQRPGGVTTKLSGGRTTIPNAFIARMPSGHEGVFARSSTKFQAFQKPTWKKKRPAIVELFGPSIGHVFIKYRPEAIDRAEESFLASFDHEMSGSWGGTPVPQEAVPSDAGAQ